MESVCPGCGETLPLPARSGVFLDRGIAIGVGGLSVLVCGCFFAEFIHSMLWPISEAHAYLVQLFCNRSQGGDESWGFLGLRKRRHLGDVVATDQL